MFWFQDLVAQAEDMGGGAHGAHHDDQDAHKPSVGATGKWHDGLPTNTPQTVIPNLKAYIAALGALHLQDCFP